MVDDERLHLLAAIAHATDHYREVIDVIASAATDEAASELLEQRFGWTAVQASAVMALQFRRVNAANKERIRDEITQIRASAHAPGQEDTGPEGFIGDTPCT
ncbi:hypothetical protein [Prescottella equi]